MLRGRGEKEAGRMLGPAVPLGWMRTQGDPHVFFSPSVSTMGGRDLEVPALCCSKNLVEGEGGSRDSKKERKGWSRASRVPSWSLAASVLAKLPPAECDFAIYLHVIIAMRCRY